MSIKVHRVVLRLGRDEAHEPLAPSIAKGDQSVNAVITCIAQTRTGDLAKPRAGMNMLICAGL